MRTAKDSVGRVVAHLAHGDVAHIVRPWRNGVAIHLLGGFVDEQGFPDNHVAVLTLSLDAAKDLAKAINSTCLEIHRERLSRHEEIEPS